MSQNVIRLDVDGSLSQHDPGATIRDAMTACHDLDISSPWCTSCILQNPTTRILDQIQAMDWIYPLFIVILPVLGTVTRMARLA